MASNVCTKLSDITKCVGNQKLFHLKDDKKKCKKYINNWVRHFEKERKGHEINVVLFQSQGRQTTKENPRRIRQQKEKIQIFCIACILTNS